MTDPPRWLCLEHDQLIPAGAEPPRPCVRGRRCGPFARVAVSHVQSIRAAVWASVAAGVAGGFLEEADAGAIAVADELAGLLDRLEDIAGAPQMTLLDAQESQVDKIKATTYVATQLIGTLRALELVPEARVTQDEHADSALGQIRGRLHAVRHESVGA